MDTTWGMNITYRMINKGSTKAAVGAPGDTLLVHSGSDKEVDNRDLGIWRDRNGDESMPKQH